MRAARSAIELAQPYAGDQPPWELVYSSHSQEGEDMVLRSLLGNQEDGFYVDVGAHHPTLYSNTCYFYRRGWRGISIDADRRAVETLLEERPRDININVGVAEEEGELDLIVYQDPALNTFDEARVAELVAKGRPHRVSHREKVKVRPLGEILHEHIEAGQRIDFLSVDVEGKELEVLRSNDWDSFRPRHVLVEVIGADIREAADNEAVRFLEAKGYVAVAKTANTVILRDDRL